MKTLGERMKEARGGMARERATQDLAAAYPTLRITTKTLQRIEEDAVTKPKRITPSPR